MKPSQEASVEIELVAGEGGDVVIPGRALAKLRATKGSRLTVRVSREALSSRLRRRGVTEEEIERISRLQLESRGHVLKMLMTEGALGHDKGIRKRARRLLR